ncbi:uncharacterized protein PHACADRAFT_251191 [Phanerochaete carnosa HHB-10118-sp]|uniref:Uncharacterized protein n=1 Tax=Phanerochaete carnosa (strain HHB-10118-sp) TaxID=650164 RepID=K5W102_PHACS|nr:uncharacterized protein PHACADRAFT_251191 [Phanerochaete carnosa HHB-10118-sp]EKM57518.1 hypothetical protein PHACADRAFT_251191 [Phanerochaete carnosa HHB-10118-sp]
MCLMVTRAPTSSLALASLHELDRLCEIFQRCSDRAPTAANHVVRSSLPLLSLLLPSLPH